MNVKNPDRLIKSDRLNYIINRMRVQQDVTPAHLAQELQVSERTIYRDMRNLERGQTLKKRYSRREGRYVFEAELTLPPITFTSSEAVALWTAASNPALSSDNILCRELRAALGKLSESLVPEADASNEANPVPLSPDSAQKPAMEMIRRGMRSNRKVRLRYWTAASDSERLISVAPYDIRAVQGSWYLTARAEEQNGGVRIFKMGRVRGVEITTERFRFPRRFSADSVFASAWERYGNMDEELAVQVRFTAAAAPMILEGRGRHFVQQETQADGSLVCTLVVNSIREIAWWVLSYGADAEVLGPPDIRTQFAQIAQTMAMRYMLAQFAQQGIR